MSPDNVLTIVREALYLTLVLSAPAVLAALAVGLLVSVLQAATQVTEQTLTAAPKIIAVSLALAVAGLWMIRALVAFTAALWERIAALG